ncbi:glycosyltransferase [Ectopseudomonas mendocina]|nr:glycosyltransferase [Pseudomonas mendocina]TXR38921.1 glycosyltransferase [Pseudomonas mendocina]
MSKIHVLMPSFAGGGAERVGVNLANSFVEEGYDVTVLVFKNSGPYKKALNKSVRLVSFGTDNKVVLFYGLLKYLRKHNVDAILSVMRDSNIILGACLYFASVNNVCFREANTLNTIWGFRWLKKSIYFGLMRLSYAKAHAIIANSEDTKKDLLVERIVSRDKIKVIGNPVLPSNYLSLASRHIAHGWVTDPEVKVILNVGRLHTQKNHIFLLESFSYLVKERGDVRLLIIGEGAERHRILEMAKQYNIDSLIDILDFQDNPYPYYKACKVFALTSSWEGFGNVLVEAMACGANIVSTNCPGGPAMILENGRLGWLVECGDAKKYAESLLDALVSEKLPEEQRIEAMCKYSVKFIRGQYLKTLFER